MQLITEDKLVWSPVVANSRMNRKRQSSGINSYEKEFKFKPETYLTFKIQESGHASWLDLCCGEGNALIQTANYFYNKGLQQTIKLQGIDLLDMFKPIRADLTCLALEAKSVVNFKPDQKFDLITCCHGIHYLGDKLKVIEMAVSALTAKGLFIANLDFNNIEIKEVDSDTFLKNAFRNFKIEYNSRSKILKSGGPADINFGVEYLGADDTVGPNYSGQDAVKSYYLKK